LILFLIIVLLITALLKLSPPQQHWQATIGSATYEHERFYSSGPFRSKAPDSSFNPTLIWAKIQLIEIVYPSRCSFQYLVSIWSVSGLANALLLPTTIGE